MFEVAELGHKLSKQEFDEKVPELHTQLLQAQRDLLDSSHSVIILISGVEGAGKGYVVNRMNEWMDSRGIKTTAYWEETDEQVMRPRYWRFWRAVPPRGSIGIMFGSWYTKPIIDRVYGKIDGAEYERHLQEIVEFEGTLTDEKAILIKLWFHLSKEKVQKNLKDDVKKRRVKLRSDPYTTKFSKEFDRFLGVSELAIRTTDKGNASWHVIEASDAHYRDFMAGRVVLESIRKVLDTGQTASLAHSRSLVSQPAKLAKTWSKPAKSKTGEVPLTVLDAVDLTRKLGNKEYKARLQKWQGRVNALSWEARAQRRSVVIVFEGWDAAGKGSTIRRITQAVDARLFQVISIGKPSDEEAAQHYLWRFWRHLPMAGYFSIYDRSWYGRVLVERVEKFTPEEDWKRGYTEINLFEQQLNEHGIIVLKFWLHLSQEEQLRRFRQREEIPWKQHKITEEDWRNRDKWNDYKLAINDMVQYTSTALAPWHLISAEDKKHGRIEVLRQLARSLKRELNQK